MGAISAVFLILITILGTSRRRKLGCKKKLEAMLTYTTVPPVGVYAVAGCGMGELSKVHVSCKAVAS